MLLSILFVTVLTLANCTEGFIAVSKSDVSRLVSPRDKQSSIISFDFAVRHASTAVDDVVDEAELVGKLRSSTVTNINNELVSLGDIMGSEKSVVVFLRHLG